MLFLPLIFHLFVPFPQSISFFFPFFFSHFTICPPPLHPSPSSAPLSSPSRMVESLLLLHLLLLFLPYSSPQRDPLLPNCSERAACLDFALNLWVFVYIQQWRSNNHFLWMKQDLEKKITDTADFVLFYKLWSLFGFGIDAMCGKPRSESEAEG